MPDEFIHIYYNRHLFDIYYNIIHIYYNRSNNHLTIYESDAFGNLFESRLAITRQLSAERWAEKRRTDFRRVMATRPFRVASALFCHTGNATMAALLLLTESLLATSNPAQCRWNMSKYLTWFWMIVYSNFDCEDLFIYIWIGNICLFTFCIREISYRSLVTEFLLVYMLVPNS